MCKFRQLKQTLDGKRALLNKSGNWEDGDERMYDEIQVKLGDDFKKVGEATKGVGSLPYQM